MTTDSPELLPCPFCGGEADIEQYGNRRQSTIYRCRNCSCSLETGEEWGHGADWNRRPDRSPAGEGWRDISTAPKNGDEVLALGGGGMAVAYWDEDEEAWISDYRGKGNAQMICPTHWMPLPPAPGAEPAPAPEREGLVEALRFYADVTLYTTGVGRSVLSGDLGSKARAALAAYEESQK